jgi:hypothetical protein
MKPLLCRPDGFPYVAPCSAPGIRLRVVNVATRPEVSGRAARYYVGYSIEIVAASRELRKPHHRGVVEERAVALLNRVRLDL